MRGGLARARRLRCARAPSSNSLTHRLHVSLADGEPRAALRSRPCETRATACSADFTHRFVNAAFGKSPWAAIETPRLGYSPGFALLAQSVEHLHGKEGVDGSSPSEGLHKSPGNGHVVLPVMTKSGLFAGTRRVHLGLAGTCGHARRLATQPGTWSRSRLRPHPSKRSCKQAVRVARVGVTLTPSFAREGFWLARLRAPGRWPGEGLVAFQQGAVEEGDYTVLVLDRPGVDAARVRRAGNLPDRFRMTGGR